MRMLGLLLVLATAPALTAQPPRPAFPGEGIWNPRPSFLVNIGVDHRDLVYEEGDALKLVCQSERDAFVYVLYHQADGNTRLLFPNHARRDERVKARQTIAIPDKGPMPPFTLRIRRPLGTEVLQVIASTRPIAELDALDLRENKLPVVSLETLDRLRDRLLREPVAWTEHRLTLRTVPSATPRPSEKAARMGLFIGIGKYRNDKVAPPHEELRKSAEEMHRLMLARGGLDPARTKLVTDHQATKKNLEDLITRWLPSISRPGDTVFIYFSGHAGQTGEPGSISPRSFPTEPDNKNELLGPYDIEPGDRFRDTGILDDTFSRWLQELTGRQVVVILDTCHAGGFIAGKHLTGFTQRSARLKNISQMNTLVLTSTSADEQALFEGMPNHTMWYTYFLTQALENDNLPRPLTVQQAHAYAAKGVQEMLKKKKEARVQEPQMADNVLLPVVMVPN